MAMIQRNRNVLPSVLLSGIDMLVRVECLRAEVHYASQTGVHMPPFTN